MSKGHSQQTGHERPAAAVTGGGLQRTPGGRPNSLMASMLQWQRTAGNRATGEWLRSLSQVGTAEAEMVALGTRGGGQPLDGPTRATMESRLGHDFSGVRIHTDASAALAAQALGARAFTVGKDIVFSGSRYSPATPSGQRLLGHELAHVVQQSRGGGQAAAGATASEAEARSAGDAVASGGTAAITTAVAPGVQKATEEEEQKQQSLAEIQSKMPSSSQNETCTSIASATSPGPQGVWDENAKMCRTEQASNASFDQSLASLQPSSSVPLSLDTVDSSNSASSLPNGQMSAAEYEIAARSTNNGAKVSSDQEAPGMFTRAKQLFNNSETGQFVLGLGMGGLAGAAPYGFSVGIGGEVTGASKRFPASLRMGYGLGEGALGLAEMIVGGVGGVGGGALTVGGAAASATGIGAGPGLPAMAGGIGLIGASATAMAEGAADVVTGAGLFMSAWHDRPEGTHSVEEEPHVDQTKNPTPTEAAADKGSQGPTEPPGLTREQHSSNNTYPVSATPEGRPASIVRNKLDQNEFQFAQEIVEHFGGDLVGQLKKHLPAIDGHLNGMPIQLKVYSGSSPTAVSRLVLESGQRAKKNGVNGLEVFIKAPNVSSEAINSGPIKTIINQESSLSVVNILTKDGWERLIR